MVPKESKGRASWLKFLGQGGAADAETCGPFYGHCNVHSWKVLSPPFHLASPRSFSLPSLTVETSPFLQDSLVFS